MIDFKVDNSKCTQCKVCVSDCPVFIINGKTEYPEIKEGKEQNCLKCQHCLAICPEGAISILGNNPENSIDINSKTPQAIELENLMKTRRSIRRFKKDEIDKALIQQIANTALYAPTAQNENSVLFTIVDNRFDMEKLRKLAYEHLKKAGDENRIPKAKLFMANFQNAWEERQIDVIFRNAPHLAIASAPKEGTLPVIDSTIALTYFDLLANSNGIGTLWDGFAKYLFEDIAPELKPLIGIPENHEVTMVLLFGKAIPKYARGIQNNKTNLIIAGKQ